MLINHETEKDHSAFYGSIPLCRDEEATTKSDSPKDKYKRSEKLAFPAEFGDLGEHQKQQQICHSQQRRYGLRDTLPGLEGELQREHKGKG